jgi:membrane protein DedA with SNARE-associated domain
MSEIFDALQSFVSTLIRNYGYPGIFLLMLIENLFPPFPSEIVMPFAGFLVARQELVFIGVILAGVLGSGLGAVIKYYFGYWLGRERVRDFFKKYGKYMFVSESSLDKGMDVFERHGYKALFYARLIPGLRSIISIPAGLARLNLA